MTLNIEISTSLCSIAHCRANVPEKVAASIAGITSNSFTLYAWTSTATAIPVDYIIFGK